MPQVDIIMPTYNRADLISAAVQSVLDQTFIDWHLYIIDDGSTDTTAQVAAAFTDERISYLPQKHTGVSASRNFGIQHGSAAFIAFLDTDNIWFPHYLERMLSAYISDSVMAYSSQNLLLMQGGAIAARRVRSEPFNLNRLMQGNYIDINSTIVRRTAIEKTSLFDKTISNLEDWDLFIRLALTYPFQIQHIDEVLGEYYYRLKSDGDTLTNAGADEQDIVRQFDMAKRSESETLVLARIKTALEQKIRSEI